MLLVGVLIAVFVVPTVVLAADDKKADDKKESSWLPSCTPPPLPLFGIEGYDGVAITYSAYLINPCRKEGQIFSKPNVGAGFLVFPSGRWMYFLQASETISDRLAISYGFDDFDISSLRDDIKSATGIDIRHDTVRMHNANMRVAAVKEGEFGLPWLPAVTFGVHYKYNQDTSDINNHLLGTLDAIGVDNNQGVEFTMYMSKLFTQLPRPLLLNVGVRNSDAAYIGLLGFTGERKFTAEANAVLFVTDRFLLAAEWRQMPRGIFDEIPGLVSSQDDWWSVAAAFLFSSHFDVSFGIFNLGKVLNEYNNGGVAFKAKYQF